MHTIQIFMSSVYCEYLDTVILTDLVKVTLAGVKGVEHGIFQACWYTPSGRKDQ
jgi:hypothetical protein